ncbi:MAG: hypothetical protein ACO3Q7_13055, partial [Steroidobacteraceae bacterium]
AGWGQPVWPAEPGGWLLGLGRDGGLPAEPDEPELPELGELGELEGGTGMPGALGVETVVWLRHPPSRTAVQAREIRRPQEPISFLSGPETR